MNFNIYLDDETVKIITDFSNKLGKSKNSIIREAIKDWIKKNRKKEWPKDFFNFPSIEELKFESNRDELKKPNDGII